MRNPPKKKTPNEPRLKNARSASKKTNPPPFIFDVADFFTSHASDFLRIIRPIKAQARKWLNDNELPFDPYKDYSGMTLPAYIQKIGHRENSSASWYMAEFLLLARYVEDCIRAKDVDSAAFWAFMFGKTYAEAGMKSQLGVDALRMRKVKKGSHVGGLNRGRQQTTDREMYWAKMQAAAERIWEKDPTRSKLAVAVKLGDKFPDSVRTIRLRIKKPTR
ncbi:hypothetical protein [Candidatus Deferrimicrobium sp.]|uniref:hypothetical protein n=1 Tax=Candidatus Deferrimicrobium sp. TaxID=3060586 RepID=UPI002ED3898D